MPALEWFYLVDLMTVFERTCRHGGHGTAAASDFRSAARKIDELHAFLGASSYRSFFAEEAELDRFLDVISALDTELHCVLTPGRYRDYRQAAFEIVAKWPADAAAQKVLRAFTGDTGPT